jgi:hypothetical protein
LKAISASPFAHRTILYTIGGPFGDPHAAAGVFRQDFLKLFPGRMPSQAEDGSPAAARRKAAAIAGIGSA